ncbi:dUTP diphosphatase [Glaciimonas sp. GG7]
MEKINAIQARTIIRLQDKINRKVDEDWLSADYPYLRGVLVEAVEALDHYGWKWWSRQPHDLSQVHIELIDILHFSLSHLINEYQGNLDEAATALFHRSNANMTCCTIDGREYLIADCDVPKLLELLAAFAASGRNELSLLTVIFSACALSWDAVMTQYIAKNVLNIFRQNKGYKKGRYVKIWGGREDNIHLVEIVARLDPNAADFTATLYQCLEERYVFYVLSPQLSALQPHIYS